MLHKSMTNDLHGEQCTLKNNPMAVTLMPTLWLAILTHNVSHADLVFWRAALVGLCVQDYKSVCSGYDLCHPG